MSIKINKNFYKIYLCIFVTLSIVLSYIEFLIPFTVANVGVNIGLCNIVSIVGIKTFGIRKTFIINIIRVFIISLLFASIVRFAISLVAFIGSYIIMCVFLKCLIVSIITSSMMGGVAHNILQVLVVATITNQKFALKLLPIYIIIGVVTGTCIGIVSSIILKVCDKLNIDKQNNFM